MRKTSALNHRSSRPNSISNSGNTVLVVDNDSESSAELERRLAEAGFVVEIAADGEQGLAAARRLLPMLIVTEVTLPVLSGLELCRALRAEAATEEIRVIMVSARQSELDRILGFEFGADDYVAKPFSSREVVLRVKAMLRRAKSNGERNVVRVGPIAVDRARCCALVDGVSIDLTRTEFKLLATLAERPDVVQTRDNLLSEVWGSENAIDNRSVDTYLRRLRNKLGHAGRHIKTVYGFGYRIAA
jgi:DNA-binding response OmpR family regulator